MINLGEPFSQEEILAAFEVEFTAVYDFFTNIAPDDFLPHQ